MLQGLLLGVLAYFTSKHIRKYEMISYILGVIIAVTLFILGESHITSEFAMGFLLVVMFAGVFSSKTTIGKRLRGVRKQYAILGFIFGLSHGLYLIFANDIEIIGLLTIIAMVPLTITSFIYVRKKMTNKAWKVLHKVSYVVYAGLFVHMLMIESYQYAIAFGLYIVFKGYHEIKRVRYNKVVVS